MYLHTCITFITFSTHWIVLLFLYLTLPWNNNWNSFKQNWEILTQHTEMQIKDDEIWWERTSAVGTSKAKSSWTKTEQKEDLG